MFQRKSLMFSLKALVRGASASTRILVENTLTAKLKMNIFQISTNNSQQFWFFQFFKGYIKNTKILNRWLNTAHDRWLNTAHVWNKDMLQITALIKDMLIYCTVPVKTIDIGVLFLHIARTTCEPPTILSCTPELGWASLSCGMVGCWQINSILANIGH